MNNDVYIDYAIQNNIEFNKYNLIAVCNKHFIIAMLESDLTGCICYSFEEDLQDKMLKINFKNKTTLEREAYVLIDLKYLYDNNLFTYTLNDITPAYLLFKE